MFVFVTRTITLCRREDYGVMCSLRQRLYKNFEIHNKLTLNSSSSEPQTKMSSARV